MPVDLPAVLDALCARTGARSARVVDGRAGAVVAVSGDPGTADPVDGPSAVARLLHEAGPDPRTADRGDVCVTTPHSVHLLRPVVGAPEAFVHLRLAGDGEVDRARTTLAEPLLHELVRSALHGTDPRPSSVVPGAGGGRGRTTVPGPRTAGDDLAARTPTGTRVPVPTAPTGPVDADTETVRLAAVRPADSDPADSDPAAATPAVGAAATAATAASARAATTAVPAPAAPSSTARAPHPTAPHPTAPHATAPAATAAEDGTTAPGNAVARTIDLTAVPPVAAAAAGSPRAAAPPATSPPVAVPSASGLPVAGPSGTGPSGTGPSGTGPSGTGPSGTGPSGTGPSGTAPSGTGPSGTAPSGTAPPGTAPSPTAPSVGGPPVAGPWATAPSATAPPVAAPPLATPVAPADSADQPALAVLAGRPRLRDAALAAAAVAGLAAALPRRTPGRVVTGKGRVSGLPRLHWTEDPGTLHRVLGGLHRLN